MSTSSTPPSAGVTRDAAGVPTIRGRDLADLARLQGREVARERAWQVELDRHRAEGTTATLLGSAGVEWDVLARRTRLDDTARRAWQGLDDATREWLAAYVDGVREGLAEGAARAPELRSLGTVPGTWRPWTPLGVLLVQHVLFGSWPHHLWRAHVRHRLDAEAADALLGAPAPAASGSNAVAVHGSRTASGAPLLAGDPHRVLEAPNVYQQVRLVCPGVDVVGLTFPGVPGVQHFGHTGDVAWGVTNAMAVAEDLRRERLRRDGDRWLVRTAEGWQPVPWHVETVTVREGEPVPVPVVQTPHGPVVVDTATFLDGPSLADTADGQETDVLTLRTPTRVDAAVGIEAVPRLLRARTVDDVQAALQDWVEPVNSVVVADTSGRVRRLVAGRVPVRSTDTAGEPAWTGEHHPLRSEDVTGLAVCANDERPDVADLGDRFAPPHRARRLREQLDGRTGLTGDDLATALLDTRSLPADTLLALLERHAGEQPDDAAAAVARELLAWDRCQDADSEAAGRYAAWRAALVARVAAHPRLAAAGEPTGLPALLGPWTSLRGRVADALPRLLSPGGLLADEAADLARAALGDVAAVPSRPWGRTHVVSPVHGMGDPARGGWDVPPTPVHGDTDCVLAAASVPGVDDRSHRGPVARWVWDLADRDASRWVVPLGASGVPDDAHALDQLPLWAAGGLLPVPGDRPADHRTVRHATHVPGLGRLEVADVRPRVDGPLVHGWVTQPRARFWQMGDHTPEQVQHVYAFVDALPTHHAYLVSLDGVPVALAQTYRPEHDPVGRCYAVRPGDLGVHLLLAPAEGDPVPGFSALLFTALLAWVLSDPATTRVVVEPDAGNERALRRLRRTGFEAGPLVDLPHKRAQLAFLTREAALRLVAGG
ncbi:GNAT family N-acetyltransferase [Thalassiella azotivora]